MTRLTNLIALRDAVKDGMATRTDVENLAYGIWQDDRMLDAGAASQGDMNAALAFHEAVLPGWAWVIESANAAEIWPLGKLTNAIRKFSDGRCPAVALFLADMAAMIAKEEGKG